MFEFWLHLLYFLMIITWGNFFQAMSTLLYFLQRLTRGNFPAMSFCFIFFCDSLEGIFQRWALCFIFFWYSLEGLFQRWAFALFSSETHLWDFSSDENLHYFLLILTWGNFASMSICFIFFCDSLEEIFKRWALCFIFFCNSLEGIFQRWAFALFSSDTHLRDFSSDDHLLYFLLILTWGNFAAMSGICLTVAG